MFLYPDFLRDTIFCVCVFFAFYCKTLQINPEWYLHKVVNWDWLLVVSRCSLFNLRVGGTFSRILWRCKITTLQTCDLCQKLPIIFVYNLERYTLHNMYLYLLKIYIFYYLRGPIKKNTLSYKIYSKGIFFLHIRKKTILF